MAKFVKVQVQNLLIDGETAGATVSGKLTLASTAALTVGDYVHNTTDGTYATITVIDSATLVTLSADIVVISEVVSIYSATASTNRLFSAERFLLAEQAGPATNGIGTTLVNYASGGTDVLTLFHVPQAALVTGMAVAVEAALEKAHSNNNRPATSAEVSLPVAVLNLSIA